MNTDMAITYVRSLRTVADDLHRTLNLLTGPKRYKGTPEEIVRKHKHDFLEWRYLINDGNLQVDFLDLDNALRILLVVYAHKDFLDLCAAGPKQRSRRWMNWPGVAWRSLQDALGRCLTRTTRQKTHGR